MVVENQTGGQIPGRRWLPVVMAVLLLAAGALVIYRFNGGQLATIFQQAEVVGTIEGQEITRQRFEEEVRLSEVKFELNQQPDRQVNRPELLNRMIGDYLIIHSANDAGVEIKDGEVQREIDSILGRFGVSRSEMDRVLADHTLRWRVFENSVWEYLVLSRYIDEVLLEDVPFNEREARLEAWMSERFREAEMDFDQAFLDEVNGGRPPGVPQ